MFFFKKNNKNLLLFLKIVVGIGLLVFLFKTIDFELFLKNLYQVNIYLIISAGFLAYVGIYVCILRWGLFLNKYKINIKKSTLFSTYLIGSFFNNFLPTSFGGDFYKVITFSKFPKNLIIASIVLERGTGFITLLTINILLMFSFHKMIFSDHRLFIIESIIACLAVAIFSFIFFDIGYLQKIRKLINNNLLNKLFEFIRNLKEGNNSLISPAFAYSFLFFALVVIAQMMYFQAFNTNVSFLYIGLVVTIVQIISILPLSFNSIGITEGLSVFLYMLVGIPAEISLAVALLARFCQILVTLSGGVLYLVNLGLRSTDQSEN